MERRRKAPRFLSRVFKELKRSLGPFRVVQKKAESSRQKAATQEMTSRSSGPSFSSSRIQSGNSSRLQIGSGVPVCEKTMKFYNPPRMEEADMADNPFPTVPTYAGSPPWVSRFGSHSIQQPSLSSARKP